MKVSSGVTPSLTSLYNKCIELSQWSTAWKMHERWTSFKESDRKEEKNYYSIKSLISVYTIFKHVLNKQLMGHYDPALYHRMTAYKKKAKQTLLALVDDWKLAEDRKNSV